MKGTYFTSKEDVKEFFRVAQMNKQEGIYATWITNPAAVKRLLPPPLEMVGPVVFAYIINIQEPTFNCPYTEGAIAVPALYNGKQGLYWISFMLAGPGACMGTVGGREIAGIPKKIADDIVVRRCGSEAHAYIQRCGKRIIDIKMDINGKYNNEAAKAVLGEPFAGLEQLMESYFFKYDLNRTEHGTMEFTDGKLLNCAFDCTYDSWEKGTCEVTFEDSINDPWGELEVIEMLGGGYVKNNIDLSNVKFVTEVDTEELMPYILTSRYDKASLTNHEESYYGNKIFQP